MKASEAIQANVNTLERRLQTGEHDDGTAADEQQMSIWTNDLASKRDELRAAEENEALQQERIQTEEAEIEQITLPYDFDELLSEEGHPITGANEMIIEVVKDTKRQANIEKNQALDDLKADYESKLKFIQDQLDHQQNYGKETFEQLQMLQQDYADLGEENISLSSIADKANSAKVQAIFERDDAYSKRDAAFRQLQEAQEEIATLKIKLENVPQAKSSLDISPSDKLAKMVKESLEAKVNRGLARWDIPTLEPVDIPVKELEEIAEPGPIEENQMGTNASGEDQAEQGNESIHAMVGQHNEESEVITLESLDARIKVLESSYGIRAA